MSGDRRGFHYALEPVRSMSAWEIDALAAELAEHNAAVASAQVQVDTLHGQRAGARATLAAQRQVQARLDIGAQRLAHAFLLHVQQQLQEAEASHAALSAARDDCWTRLTAARKFAEGLDRDREAAAADHDRRVQKQQYQLSDDSWLQRQHGSTPA